MSQVASVKKRFAEEEAKVMLKGNSVEPIKAVALEVIAKLERDYAALKVDWKAWADKCQALEFGLEQVEAKALAMQGHWQETQIELDRVKAQSNRERKAAVARANRFKAKYEQLLIDIDTVLPGAKAALTTKAISEEEKIKRLTEIDNAIAAQQAAVRGKVDFDESRWRDIHLSGYRKEARLLERLQAKKRQLMAQKSY